jgi:hypothetical protein
VNADLRQRHKKLQRRFGNVLDPFARRWFQVNDIGIVGFFYPFLDRLAFVMSQIRVESKIKSFM